jgi:uncharacterized integral membrane protein (TIGR00697 family)
MLTHRRSKKMSTKKGIWLIAGLIGLYVASQLIADVAATKLVEIGGVVMPGGTFIFALTFTLRDIIHKRLGREWARAAIVLAAAFNLLLAGYMWVVAQLPSPVFFELGDAWAVIFSIVPAITIGSIIAELVSQTTDTEVYHFWKGRFPTWPQWTRVLVSNAVALPVDSIVFTLLAFVILPSLFGAQSMPLGVAVTRIVSGQILFKVVVTVLSLPLIYTVKDEQISFSVGA